MSGDYDFWDNLLREANLSRETSGMDTHIASRDLEGEQFTSMRELTDRHREATALTLPVEAGTRVAFKGALGAYLSMDNPPSTGTQGTVVTVKSAQGDVTSHDGMVFVQWDDGIFRSVHANYLKPGEAMKRMGHTGQRIRVASLGDLGDFLKVADDTLVHRATRDLWSLKRDGEAYVIERLFDDVGEPLRV